MWLLQVLQRWFAWGSHGPCTEPDAQRGRASFYDGDRFEGWPMANGDRFDPQSNAAASKTLPLGTVADVTNRETGETRRVVIEDRGPYVQGRVIDVSPRAVEELGMRHDGVAHSVYCKTALSFRIQLVA